MLSHHLESRGRERPVTHLVRQRQRTRELVSVHLQIFMYVLASDSGYERACLIIRDGFPFTKDVKETT